MDHSFPGGPCSVCLRGPGDTIAGCAVCMGGYPYPAKACDVAFLPVCSRYVVCQGLCATLILRPPQV